MNLIAVLLMIAMLAVAGVLLTGIAGFLRGGAFNERYGPDQPWGFADPTSWKCSPRYCAHWASCPGGRGL